MDTPLPHIAVLYDSSCRCSNTLAEILEKNIDWAMIDLCNLLTVSEEDIPTANHLILALPMHAFGNPDRPWEDAWPILSSISYRHRQVLICGLGTEFCFDDDRLLALENLQQAFRQMGASLISQLPDALSYCQRGTDHGDPYHLIYPQSGSICQRKLTPSLMHQWIHQLKSLLQGFPAALPSQSSATTSQSSATTSQSSATTIAD